MLPDLRTGLRHLRRRKLFAALNVGGLAVGIGAFLLIGLFLHHELSHDRHFPEHRRTYRLILDRPVTPDRIERRVVLPEPIGPDLVAWSPEVEEMTRVAAGSFTVHLQVGERLAKVEELISADPSFFRVFPRRALGGDPARALDAPGSIVLTAPVARALFGDADAVGETVHYAGSSGDGLTVTAVLAEAPGPSHLAFDAVMRREDHGEARWNYYSVRTYVRLAEGARGERVREALPRFVAEHLHVDHPLDEAARQQHALTLQPLAEVHLAGDVTAEAASASPLRYVRIFGLVAALLLGIACINYVNLATAYATERAREVGMRRTLGATRRQVARQFLGESALVALLALPVALGAVALALPRFADVAGIPVAAGRAFSPDFVAFGAAVALAVGLVSGLYPAAVLSRFAPRRAMGEATGGRGTGARLRQGLVVTQFAVSAALVVCALTIGRQVDLIREARLGGVDEEVVMLFAGGTPGEKEALKAAVIAGPDVVAASYGPAPNHTPFTSNYTDRGADPITVRGIGVDEGYLETLGLELVAGEPLTAETAVPQGTPVLLNETAMRVLGASLGEKHPRFELTPVGVVRDYHFVPLHEPITPLRIDYAPHNWHPLLVRLRSGHTASGVEHLSRVWAEHRPDRPIEYRFLDEELDRSYRAEIRMGVLIRALTAVTVFLAGLGLFGLAAFAAQQRAREVGIRKVLGASVASVVALLSWRFVGLVAVSLVVGAPAAYYAMGRWLEGFAYRVELGWGPFALTAALALGVALLAVGYHAVRAALADPARTLRSE